MKNFKNITPNRTPTCRGLSAASMDPADNPANKSRGRGVGFSGKCQPTLAILFKPGEATAPSNQKALDQFVTAGKELGMQVDLIHQRKPQILDPYDGLFIRTTTAVQHYTYLLSRYAEQRNMVVIDDPSSIIKCTNKIFLTELFRLHHIPTLPTVFINKYDRALPAIDFPCVLKKPDGSCSQGVLKINNRQSLERALTKLFKTSDLLLIQPFMPTEFDWRIGIIDNQPLFACRYYMAKNHWQIVNWNCDIKDDILIFDAIPLKEVPHEVMALALNACRLIGDGLYGVDIKSIHDQHYVIEVNDNPSINFGIEDKVEETLLYRSILEVFLQRLGDQLPHK